MRTNFEKIRRGKVGLSVFAMAMVISLSSCLNSDNESTPDPAPVAYVSLFHASPVTTGLDVFLDNKQINNQPLPYAGYTGYLQFYTGTRNLKFNSFNAANALVDTTFNFQANKTYSVFVIDEWTDAKALIVEDSIAETTTNNAFVRFVNLSPDAPALDLAVKDNTGTVFSSQSFKDITEFKEVDAANYTFQVKDTGGSDVIVSSSDILFQPGRAYTIIARGFKNPPSGNSNAFTLQIVQN